MSTYSEKVSAYRAVNFILALVFGAIYFFGPIEKNSYHSLTGFDAFTHAVEVLTNYFSELFEEPKVLLMFSCLIAIPLLWLGTLIQLACKSLGVRWTLLTMVIVYGLVISLILSEDGEIDEMGFGVWGSIIVLVGWFVYSLAAYPGDEDDDDEDNVVVEVESIPSTEASTPAKQDPSLAEILKIVSGMTDEELAGVEANPQIYNETFVTVVKGEIARRK